MKMFTYEGLRNEKFMAKPVTKKIRRANPAVKKSLNWLWGKNSVLDTLKAGRWRVYELFITSEARDWLSSMLSAPLATDIELHLVSNEELSKLAQTADHQGIVARVSKYPYVSLENFEKELVAAMTVSDPSPSQQPLVVLIDRIQDNFNFASLLRCCQYAGVNAVLVGEHCQSQVTTQISRLSDGAVNHLSIVQSSDLQATAARLKELGLKLLAIDPAASESLEAVSLKIPMGLLVGSDSNGLTPSLLELCDHRLCIPGLGSASCLSPSISAGLVLYETRRQHRA